MPPRGAWASGAVRSLVPCSCKRRGLSAILDWRGPKSPSTPVSRWMTMTAQPVRTCWGQPRRLGHKMKSSVAVVLSIELFFVGAVPLFAAEAKAPSNEGVFFVHTGTPGGTCKVDRARDGVTSVKCVDGRNMATYKRNQGCLDSSGSGYCGLDVEWMPGLSGAQLNCGHGVSYFLFSGAVADNLCRSKHGTKSCETADGAGYARASCDGGCANTAEGGNCCQVGTPGCPPAAKSNAAH